MTRSIDLLGEDQDLAAFACFVTKEGGRKAMEALATAPQSMQSKIGEMGADFDPVTAGDRAAEQRMRALICERFPEDGIVGEEFEDRPSTSGRRWVLDPIDGTRSFLCAIPLWMTLLALMEGDEVLLGVAYQPVLQELYLGGGGKAFLLQAQGGLEPIHTAPCPSLCEALGGTTGPLHYQGNAQLVYRRFLTKTRLLRHDADAYFYCLLARGRLHFALDCGLKPYDIAPLIPIVRGAGGCVTTWSGGVPCRGGAILATATQALQNEGLAWIGEDIP